VRIVRRGILVGGISAVACVALYAWQRQRPSKIARLSQRLRAQFPEIAPFAWKLNELPELARFGEDREMLARAIFSADVATVLDLSPKEMMQLLARAVDRDFTDNRLVSIRGWTLSETEYRLLAFIASGES